VRESLPPPCPGPSTLRPSTLPKAREGFASRELAPLTPVRLSPDAAASASGLGHRQRRRGGHARHAPRARSLLRRLRFAASFRSRSDAASCRRHGAGQGCPEPGSQAGEGAAEQVLWGAAEGAGAAQAGEEEAEGRPHRSLQLPDRRGQGGGGWALLPRTQRQDERRWPQAASGGFRLEIGENVCAERVVRGWARLPRAGGESPSLEGFKNRGDVALGDTV